MSKYLEGKIVWGELFFFWKGNFIRINKRHKPHHKSTGNMQAPKKKQNETTPNYPVKNKQTKPPLQEDNTTINKRN